MASKNQGNYPPSKLLQRLYLIPVYFYRWGLGWLFGKRFVLFQHIGRKSGKHYQTVVEVVEIEKDTGNVIVVAGYGNQTQWYQNFQNMQSTTIQLGKHKFTVTIEMLSPENGADIMARYYQRYGNVTGMLFSILGYEWDGTEQGARQVARDHLRFVRFVR
ncbi:MAG: nitroreductase family deazaflavin-dependent oxidoreductase [Anaerolineaceae bacterium]|nr:nitroreductase family deazaflavin-dependent oxidoreductase [Anaerolineaceae bacterium]